MSAASATGQTISMTLAAGGKAPSPIIDNPKVGRMSVVADPSGAVFGVIQPASA